MDWSFTRVLNLDSPWKIAGLVAALVLLRVVATLWKGMPCRPGVMEFADSALVAVTLVFVLVRPLLVQSFFIPSESMVNTLLVDDKILANKFIYHIQPPRRGDVVVFKAPPVLDGTEVAGQDLVKRLIGLPGDTIEIRAYDGVYINGRQLNEPYLTADHLPNYNYGPFTVPPGNVFVLGDNRPNSLDSHLWGPLPMQYLRGKAMLLYWPPGRVRVIR